MAKTDDIPLFWNDSQIQPTDSAMCDYYVVAWIKYLRYYGPSKKTYIDFVKRFDDKTQKGNDALAKKLVVDERQ